MRSRHAWLAVGVLLCLAVLLGVPATLMPPAATRVAAVTVLMAVFWISEALPIPATALLPVVLFPLLDVMSVTDTTQNYAHHLVFLFLGGFWIAAAIERCGLHRRLALQVLRLMGGRADRVLFGFMAATAFLSMWLSNTATTMMMLPIALAITARHSGGSGSPFGRALMLGIAYAASIGGVATLVGTPPNAVLAGIAEKTVGRTIGFGQWLQFGLPLALSMLLICWWYLARLGGGLRGLALGRDDQGVVVELDTLGRMTAAERRTLAVFVSVAGLWVFRGLIPWPPLQDLGDSAIAIAGALALFLIPAGPGRGETLLTWEAAARVHWDVLILFGGGFALAQGFQTSGLTEWIGQQMDFLAPLHWLVLVGAVAAVTLFLTEVTSNTATASMLLPIVAGLAAAAGHDPFPAMVAAALAASFAFMLPVATPPNAIVFASRQVTIAQMARVGVWMNLIGLVVITAFVAIVLPLIWTID